jgi:tryptophan halogenase
MEPAMSNADTSCDRHAPELARTLTAGGDPVGWMAAAAFSHFLESGFKVTLVETEAIRTVGVGEETILQIPVFKQALGIDVDASICATQARSMWTSS